LLPPLAEVREVSRRIALAVGREAQRQALAREVELQRGAEDVLLFRERNSSSTPAGRKRRRVPARTPT
jgi:hypothetical protein